MTTSCQSAVTSWPDGHASALDAGRGAERPGGGSVGIAASATEPRGPTATPPRVARAYPMGASTFIAQPLFLLASVSCGIKVLRDLRSRDVV